jgi:hypothetical protein
VLPGRRNQDAQQVVDLLQQEEIHEQDAFVSALTDSDRSPSSCPRVAAARPRIADRLTVRQTGLARAYDGTKLLSMCRCQVVLRSH